MAKKPSKPRLTRAQQGSQGTYKVMNRLFEGIFLGSERDLGATTTQLMNLYFSLMQSADITKSVEIGSYEASFSMKCQRQHPDITSIAFEANPYVFEKFNQGVRKAGVDYRHTCVAGKNGKVTFSVPRDYKGQGRAGDHQFASLMDGLNSEKVETYDVKSVRLDDAIDLQKNDRLALWVDVEGATEVVFSGAAKSLAKTAMVFIEVEKLALWDGQWLDHDVFSFLSNLGFVPIARDYQRDNQYNYIYINTKLMDPLKYTRAHDRYIKGEGEYSK